MKVLMINVVCGTGSTGRICTVLAEALEARGHEVRIAYGRGNVPEKYQRHAVRTGTGWDILLHGAEARLCDAAGFGSRRATGKLIRWIREYGPDVIHLHNIHGYYINIEVLFGYLRTCGKRIIWTMHDCWAFTGHSAVCDGSGCEKWETGCGECPQKREYPESVTDRSRRNWERKRNILTGIPGMSVVTPSGWLAGCVKRSFLKEYPVTVINNGADTGQFHPVPSDFAGKRQIEEKFIVLGVAGAFGDMKGFTDYCALADMLDSSFAVVLVGIKGRQGRKLRRGMIGIPATGSVRELAEIYSCADVFLNLTYCDTYPTVNLEARACGLPVVTYDTGGSPEAAGEGGYVIEKGNIKEAVSTLKWLKKRQGKCRHKVIREDMEKLDSRHMSEAYIRYMEQENGSGQVQVQNPACF